MSKLIAPADFTTLVQKNTAVFSPASARTLEAWKADIEDCLKKLKYMQIARLTGTTQYDRLLNYRGNLTVTSGVLEAVKADIEKMWSVEVAAGLSAQHSFFETSSGFEFRAFAMNSSNEFVTLRVLIVDSPKE